MAAPMLFASVMPRSTTRPHVVCVKTTGACFEPEIITAPAPVTVHCAVGVRCPPYSSGSRNCRSAEQKCELVMAHTVSAYPPSIVIAASDRLSAIVEHAP